MTYSQVHSSLHPTSLKEKSTGMSAVEGPVAGSSRVGDDLVEFGCCYLSVVESCCYISVLYTQTWGYVFDVHFRCHYDFVDVQRSGQTISPWFLKLV